MTNIEKEEMISMLEYLKGNKSINEYKVNAEDNIVYVNTDEKDEDDITFLKFRIIASACVINQELGDLLTVEIVE